MEFRQRLQVLARLKTYMQGNDEAWLAAKQKAFTHNGWFVPEFIELAANNISEILLNELTLQQWGDTYGFANQKEAATIGVVMPGNIPLAGFYQLLAVFAAGHKQRIRLSQKDEVLIPHLVRKMTEWDAEVAQLIMFEEMLKGCDAYVASVDNKTSEQFEKYFSKYPHYISRAGSSAAVLTGNESKAEFETLADDVFWYFGRGCMNVTRLYVPRNFDFIPLIKSFDKYRYLIDHNKYKNNYDYQLALLILNKGFYMTNGCILLTENTIATVPVAMLYYSYYDAVADVKRMAATAGVKRLVGEGFEKVGRAGESVVCDGRGEALLQFLRSL